MKLIIEKMLPVVAGEGLADYIDVFCEEGFFGCVPHGGLVANLVNCIQAGCFQQEHTAGLERSMDTFQN